VAPVARSWAGTPFIRPLRGIPVRAAVRQSITRGGLIRYTARAVFIRPLCCRPAIVDP
jgi:hypothetical protein